MSASTGKESKVVLWPFVSELAFRIQDAAQARRLHRMFDLEEFRERARANELAARILARPLRVAVARSGQRKTIHRWVKESVRFLQNLGPAPERLW